MSTTIDSTPDDGHGLGEAMAAVVTGASSGIGQAAAIRIAERGVSVIVTYSSNHEGAADTVATIEQAGGRAAALPLDLGRSDTFAGFAAAVAEQLDAWGGRLTALVNNAGSSGSAPFGDMTEELYDDLHRVLLKGPYFLTQHLLPLLADGGAIVNVASTSAHPSGMTRGYSAYATLKGGLIVFTRVLAQELSARRIRVNAVSPGATRTRLGDNAFERMPEIVDAIAAETAFGRIGESDDLGKVIASLVSDEFAWMTGQDLEVSGGARL